MARVSLACVLISLDRTSDSRKFVVPCEKHAVDITTLALPRANNIALSLCHATV